jgi:hypothetical protein
MLALALSFLGSPLGRAAAFAGVSALAILTAGGVGFVKGDRYRAGIDTAAQAAFLQKQATAREAADKVNAALAVEDAATTTKTQEQTNEAVRGTSAGTCLDGNDADKLRSLWDNGRKPAARAKRP